MAGVVFLASFFVAMNGVMLIVNLFIQVGLGFTPMHTGLAMTPLAVGLAIGAAASGAALGPKFGRKVLHGGLVVIGLGMVGLWLTIDHVGTDDRRLGPGARAVRRRARQRRHLRPAVRHHPGRPRRPRGGHRLRAC